MKNWVIRELAKIAEEGVKMFYPVEGFIERLEKQIEELQEENNRLKTDGEYFKNEVEYGGLVMEIAQLSHFQETTKRIVGEVIYQLILEEMEEYNHCLN